jgi:hypothetical protein
MPPSGSQLARSPQALAALERGDEIAPARAFVVERATKRPRAWVGGAALPTIRTTPKTPVRIRTPLFVYESLRSLEHHRMLAFHHERLRRACSWSSGRVSPRDARRRPAQLARRPRPDRSASEGRVRTGSNITCSYTNTPKRALRHPASRVPAFHGRSFPIARERPRAWVGAQRVPRFARRARRARRARPLFVHEHPRSYTNPCEASSTVAAAFHHERALARLLSRGFGLGRPRGARRRPRAARAQAAPGSSGPPETCRGRARASTAPSPTLGGGGTCAGRARIVRDAKGVPRPSAAGGGIDPWCRERG